MNDLQLNQLFTYHLIIEEGEDEKDISNMLYQPVCTVDLTKEVKLSQPEDNDMLMHFQTWVSNYNKYIQTSYEENANNNTLTSEQEDVIEGFITVDEGN